MVAEGMMMAVWQRDCVPSDGFLAHCLKKEWCIFLVYHIFREPRAIWLFVFGPIDANLGKSSPQCMTISLVAILPYDCTGKNYVRSLHFWPSQHPHSHMTVISVLVNHCIFMTAAGSYNCRLQLFQLPTSNISGKAGREVASHGHVMSHLLTTEKLGAVIWCLP